MTEPNLPDPVMITQREPLKELAARLMMEPVIAVDTESNSLYAYYERVCLIQFSTSEADYLVDPLALDDLSPLAPVFADARVEKVFHAADYDVACLKRDFGFEFSNLFDTMIAARILGRRAIGLGSILEAEFGVHLNKRYQRANWGQRPLSQDLLSYARLDTHYLIPLRHRLKAALEVSGRWPLAEEDFARLCKLEARVLKTEGGDCWRVQGAYDLNPHQAAVLQELCRYRDEVARRLDRPVFKVFNDATLLAIASECPRDTRALQRVLGKKFRRLKRHHAAFLKAVKRGLEAPPAKPPWEPRPNGEFIERLETLRRWRKNEARRLGVSSDVVLPRDLMVEIAHSDPLDEQKLACILQDVPWRLARFGPAILAALNHKVGWHRR